MLSVSHTSRGLADCLPIRFRKSGKRNDIFLATKFGFNFDDPSGRQINGSAAYVKKAFEKSLSRLGVEVCDVTPFSPKSSTEACTRASTYTTFTEPILLFP